VRKTTRARALPRRDAPRRASDDEADEGDSLVGLTCIEEKDEEDTSTEPIDAG